MSPLNLYAGQRFLILGLGVSGLAMAKWCCAQGASVVVVDSRRDPPGMAELVNLAPQVQLKEQSSLAQLAPFNRICKSPGLTPNQVRGMLEGLDCSSSSRASEADLFAEALDHLSKQQSYHPAVIGITGTNGKTTVTALTHHLLISAGKSAMVAGNIGPSLLDALSTALDHESLPEVWVLELSSFQLADAVPLALHAAVVLNVTQDHLDWHGSMEAYRAAKAKVFEKAQCRVVNRDDQFIRAIDRPRVTSNKFKRLQPLLSTVSFGGKVPEAPGDFGLEEAQGLVWLVRAVGVDVSHKQSQPIEVHIQRMMPLEALRIAGRHNALNALAALALCTALGAPISQLLKALRTYAGEPHRVQSVATVKGINFIDDSKGTNTGATVAAINGMGPAQRLIVILGGQGKGQDFSPLLAPLTKYARAVVLIGQDGPAIGQVLSEVNLPMRVCHSMEEAVGVAAAFAQPGDAVLLSPACASLDMFRNYVHRAEVFRAAVQQLEQTPPQSETRAEI